MQSENGKNSRTPPGGYNLNLSFQKGTRIILQRRFTPPVYTREFWDQLRENCVKLENVVIDGLKCFATVKVKNLAYEKVVRVQYTLDNWKSNQDQFAYHLKDSNSGYADTFAFELNVPDNEDIKELQFAIAFICNQNEYWDNNQGKNYRIECVPI